MKVATPEFMFGKSDSKRMLTLPPANAPHPPATSATRSSTSAPYGGLDYSEHKLDIWLRSVLLELEDI